MFENVQNLVPVIFPERLNTLKFFNELTDDNIIPIGIIIRQQKVYYQNQEMIEDLLPCIVYKENYKA